MWKIDRVDSSEVSVSKFIFKKENAIAEAVLYKYPTYEKRTVICCSVMSGCPMGCRFCGTGEYFVRSLKADEIVSQPEYLLEQTGVDPSKIGRLQIMFMSMGEPMLNYDELEKALIQLYQKYPNAALLISTSAPRGFRSYKNLEDLSVEIPTIGLQFSVHESTDSKRKSLIPAPTLSLEEIAEKGESWANKTGRRPFFNYCVHGGNNKQEDVDNLYRLFNPNIWEATISVICERDENVAAANARQRELANDFTSKMLAAGYSTRMFDPAGQDDIGGGCGQLWFVQDWMKNNPSLAKPTAGLNQPKVHAPGVK